MSDDQLADEMPETIVVFRKYKHDNHEIIALFPYEKHSGNYCSSFMHIGQHGSADYALVIAGTVPATEKEYWELKAELEGHPYGYILDVRSRKPSRKFMA